MKSNTRGPARTILSVVLDPNRLRKSVMPLQLPTRGDSLFIIRDSNQPIDALGAVPSSFCSHHSQGYRTPIKMSLFAPPLISLLFFSSFAVAGIYAPDCSTTSAIPGIWVCILSCLQSRLWLLPDLVAVIVQSFNSLGQNACMVAAFMISTCYGGCELFARLLCLVLAPATSLIVSSSFPAYTLDALAQGYSYGGPNGGDSTTCVCNTVTYSLISACGGCQGENWITYDSCSHTSSTLGAHMSIISWSEFVTNCTAIMPPSS